jgi:serine protease AprX
MPTQTDAPALPIPGTLVDLILLGPADDRRQLQDSPILGDVWLAYAANPAGIQDLLITPHKTATAGQVAREISERLKRTRLDKAKRSQVAYLQGIVAARLYLDELLRVLVPLTQWWDEREIQKKLADLKPTVLRKRLEALFNSALAAERRHDLANPPYDDFEALERYLALAGLILWASRMNASTRSARSGPKRTARRTLVAPSVEEVLVTALQHLDEVVDALTRIYKQITAPAAGPRSPALIFQVSLNRRVMSALDRSVAAVKGDAARTLFSVDSRKIAWAVLDSGIDGTHPAFLDATGKESRVRKTFDFTRVRELVSADNDRLPDADLARLLEGVRMTKAEAKRRLRALRLDCENQRPINWDVVEELLTLQEPSAPLNPHGTHVAGIIGARQTDDVSQPHGMCPEIQLYDFRVLARTLDDTEFAVIAALQYIRYVNERHSYVTIHGANLSLSIPHNVRNYACGRTPVCNECQRLVESGVVVVAAAGNRGYQRFETKEGLFENYAAFSITDPGNADDVLTVGATHGNWPHTYGVSFFSSRGPTGDGRLKPDLVAPGERIKAPVPHGAWRAESGTSMAAPHVSGASAMLMARYPELIGNPRRIKKILCDSATDLGRERSFQGYGMLDVLRAFQSI